jgi:cellulose synthase/poly-beta-1,6-N-acetylglucosamine synthase-like glycosyltransferase
MLLKFNLYDLYVLSFVQLVVTTVLVLSPARDIGTRFRWTGSRITEVLLGAVGAAAISALSCVFAFELWGIPLSGLESAAYVLVLISVMVIALQADRNVVGQVFYASFASSFVISTIWAAYIAVVATHSILEMMTASLVILLDLGAAVVWLSYINYGSDVLCRSRRSRPLPKADPSYQPMVSLHIPAYNEPPDLLIETIKAVERIDYPDFEIVVVDNNTRDPAVWQPVEEYCRDRPRVKFVHVAPWPGYKAGACNLALRRYTDPRAEIIGLVDADDIVQPFYLKETVSYFSDPNLGFIQTCEGNRDFEGSPYYTACVDSYQSFYLSVMSSRNERDTVPFVGTMGLFRRSALSAIGGWNEWCISEDTEASLRVLKDGWSGLYIPRCFGRGIVPPSFAGMLTQRHRWCFGAMQIMRLHWRSLMPWDRSPDNHLTSAQRRDYLMASLGWFRDLLMLAFTLLLLAITGLLATHSGFYVSPMDGTKSLLPLSFILIATLCMMWSLCHWTTLSYRRAVLSLVISLSVAFVVARGCIEGMARRDGVFLRTNKSGGRRSVFTALRLVPWETTLAVALFISLGLLVALPHPQWILIVIVIIQGLAYACSPITAVWNLRARGVSAETRRLRAERRRRSWAWIPRPAAAALGALCLGGVTGAYIAPAALLHATTLSARTASPQSLLAASSGTQAYLELATDRTYYPITSAHLADLAASSATSPSGVGLRFDTSSAVLLGLVLRAAADGGRISHVSLALRVSGSDGRSATELVDTFATATITSFEAHLARQPAGHVSLLLPATGSIVSTPGALQQIGPFDPPSGSSGGSAAKVYAAIQPMPFSPVTAVTLAQSAPSAPLDLSVTTSSLPLLQAIFQDEGAAGIPTLTLSVRSGSGGPLRFTFSRLSVNSFAENLSPLSGTAALVVSPP